MTSCQFIQNDKNIEYFQYLSNGKNLYEKHCQNCHGAKGEGFQALYPPLTDTTYLRKNKRLLACMIKNGIKNDSIQINKKWYSDNMPNNNLTTIDIAQIIVYVTNNFGNEQGNYPYKNVQEDLENCLIKK